MRLTYYPITYPYMLFKYLLWTASCSMPLQKKSMKIFALVGSLSSVGSLNFVQARIKREFDISGGKGATFNIPCIIRAWNENSLILLTSWEESCTQWELLGSLVPLISLLSMSDKLSSHKMITQRRNDLSALEWMSSLDSSQGDEEWEHLFHLSGWPAIWRY